MSEARPRKPPAAPETIALRRAAKAALAKARLTGTPAYALVDGRIVDLAKRPPAYRKKLRGC